MSPRTHIVYYSMTGHSAGLAGEIAQALGGSIEEIREVRPRRGMFRFLGALRDAIGRRASPIQSPRVDPADCDLLVIGGPVWASGTAPALRSYAREHAMRAPRVAFFATFGGRDADKAFAELGALCGRAPDATLAVDKAHLPTQAHREPLQRFVQSLRECAAR